MALTPSSGEPPFRLYDTSGPYTDPAAPIDVAKGLAAHRAPWLALRRLDCAEARAIRPEDNRNVGGDRLVPPFPVAQDVRRGQAGQPVTQLEFARAGIVTEEDFLRVIRVNLGAAYELTRACSFADGAGVVSLASRAYLGNFGQFNYTMSKGGLVGMTRALSLSLAPGVRVNAVAPGLIATEMAMAIPEDVLEKMVAAIPLDRMGTPQDIANVVWFLLSPLSAYITGEVLVVGGGRSLSR